MKKLLGILVLGLLFLSACETMSTHEVLNSGKIKAGISKTQLKGAYGQTGTSNDPFLGGCFKEYHPDSRMEIISSKDKDVWFVFEKVNWPMSKCSFKTMGDGVLYKWFPTYSEAKSVVSKKQTKKIKPKKKKPKKSPDDDKVVAAASGSGFFVSNAGHIVTNHHVIDECKVLKVSYKGNLVEAKVLAIDKTNDLAIIQAKINPSKVYAVSNKDVALLEDIIVAGFPLGKNVSSAIKTHKGNVTALAGFGDNYSNFQTDATINQGNSGGPVMDYKGNIVGVAVALMSAEAGQNIFFAVKSSTLKTFANSNGISFLPPSNREMSNAELGQLITEGTLFLECWMTIAKIKQIIAQEENRKAFYSEHK